MSIAVACETEFVQDELLDMLVWGSCLAHGRLAFSTPCRFVKISSNSLSWLYKCKIMTKAASAVRCAPPS
eukprot:6560500-Alexandrium_andersonii.AAC.1